MWNSDMKYWVEDSSLPKLWRWESYILTLQDNRLSKRCCDKFRRSISLHCLSFCRDKVWAIPCWNPIFRHGCCIYPIPLCPRRLPYLRKRLFIRWKGYKEGMQRCNRIWSPLLTIIPSNFHAEAWNLYFLICSRIQSLSFIGDKSRFGIIAVFV